MGAGRRLMLVALALGIAGGAAGGALFPRDRPLAAGLLGGAGAFVLVAIAVGARRRHRRRTGGRGATLGEPLSRVEFVPPVTRPAPRLHWRGSPHWRIRPAAGPPAAVDGGEIELPGAPQRWPSAPGRTGHH